MRQIDFLKIKKGEIKNLMRELNRIRDKAEEIIVNFKTELKKSLTMYGEIK